MTQIDKSRFEWIGSDSARREGISRPSTTFWKDAIGRLMKNKVAVVCFFIIVLLIVTVYPEHFLYLISLFAIRKVKGLYEDFRTLKGLELNQTLFNTVKLEMQFAILLTIGALLDALWHWVL